MQKIQNIDLYKKQYSLEILQQNVMSLSFAIILQTQHVTPEFCVKFILNDDFYEGVEESYLYTVDYVLKKQPHITEKDLLMYM